ncbi:MAG: hypothetical protein DBX91_10490 [Subdoligranulum variabile]|nr:MAG: hypothetical protein DBX91_10490 [Subdoligranulum variabile]
MKKAIPCLLAAVLALALCACSGFDDKYDDEDFLTGKADSSMTMMWMSNIENDGSIALNVGSYSGVKTLGTFTVEQDQSVCDVTSTLDCTSGEAKLLVVNTDDRTIAAEWPVGSGDPMTVTLPAGDYKLRIAGKSAKFEGAVTLMLDGQIQEWGGISEKLQDVLDELPDGEAKDTMQDVKDALQSAQSALQEGFGDDRDTA